MQVVPLVIFEQKRNLHGDCPETEPLAEPFIQAYYSLKFYKLSSIIACLSDSRKFFYYNMSLAGVTLKISFIPKHPHFLMFQTTFNFCTRLCRNYYMNNHCMSCCCIAHCCPMNLVRSPYATRRNYIHISLFLRCGN